MAWRFGFGLLVLGPLVVAACSGSSKNGSAGSGGTAGAAGSDEPGGGGASSAGKNSGGKGGGAQAGSGGSAVGGSALGGQAMGGSADGGAAGAPTSGVIEAKSGQVCSAETKIGTIRLSGFDSMPYVDGSLWDRPDPWIGKPELTTDTCAYHRYKPGNCASCAAGETCSLESKCVPERRTIKDATLRVSTGAAERTYAADAQLGNIYSQLDIGDVNSSFEMTLSWGDTEVHVAPMKVGSDQLKNLHVDIAGTSEAPGALKATWAATQPGTSVLSTIPINHHAGGPTFTECSATESSGQFDATADMVDPLSVITGLEFQGVEHAFVAAAITPQGCVDFRFGAQIYTTPD